MIVVPEYEGSERRRAPRIPLCLPASVECDAWTALCHIRDVSESGIYLISQTLPSLAVGFSLQVPLPGRFGTLRAHGQVVRIQEDNPRGFGLNFVRLPSSELTRIQDLAGVWQALLAGRLGI